MVPALLAQCCKVDPQRSVRQQTPTAQLWSEQGFAVGDAVGLACRFEAGSTPRIFRALDDEGAGVRIEGIGGDLEQAVVVATKDEGERVERQVAAKPHVFRRVHRYLRLEELAIRPPKQAVDAIPADDEVGTLQLPNFADLALELQPHPKRPAAPLEDVEQHLARDASKD